MIKPGLVSITFRKLPPETIIALAMENTLAAIEWGGDIHVPHGNIAVARSVAKMTRDSGLKTAAYGSYYHLIESKSQGLEFRTVLDTAVELEAPLIRIWPGGIASSQADDNYRKLAIEETQAIAQLAAKQNITIAFELHRETLTDTGRSALQSVLVADPIASTEANVTTRSIGVTLSTGAELRRRVTLKKRFLLNSMRDKRLIWERLRSKNQSRFDYLILFQPNRLLI